MSAIPAASVPDSGTIVEFTERIQRMDRLNMERAIRARVRDWVETGRFDDRPVIQD